MMARFRNFYNLNKSQDLVLKGTVRFGQVQRFIEAKKYFGVMGTFKQTRKVPIQTLVNRIFVTQHRLKARVAFAYVSF